MTGYAGFDRSEYPGQAVMAWLKANTNFDWCALYLPSPSHGDDSWWNAARFTDDLGDWGLAPVYVGQQTTGPGSHLVSTAEGTVDGADACQKMAGVCDKGSCVYLDLENGPPMSAAQSEYVGAWCDAVTAGGYLPGVYCSFEIAAQVKTLRLPARIWVFHVRTVSPHKVPLPNFPTPDPATSGYSGAWVWQLDDEAIIPCPVAPGGTLTVDLDSASSADPSAP